MAVGRRLFSTHTLSCRDRSGRHRQEFGGSANGGSQWSVIGCAGVVVVSVEIVDGQSYDQSIDVFVYGIQLLYCTCIQYVYECLPIHSPSLGHHPFSLLLPSVSSFHPSLSLSRKNDDSGGPWIPPDGSDGVDSPLRCISVILSSNQMELLGC